MVNHLPGSQTHFPHSRRPRRLAFAAAAAVAVAHLVGSHGCDGACHMPVSRSKKRD